ncbi:hypothetical protein [Wolbachia endosymbiont (group A) of Brachyopa scutellaris]
MSRTGMTEEEGYLDDKKGATRMTWLKEPKRGVIPARNAGIPKKG